MADGINCSGDLQRYDHLFDKLMDIVSGPKSELYIFVAPPWGL